MRPITRKLLDELDASRDRLELAVSGIRQEQWQQQPAADRWSAAEVLEHLSMVEGSITGMLLKRSAEARSAGMLAAPDDDDAAHGLREDYLLDRGNRRTATEASTPRGLDGVAALEALRAIRARLRDAVIAADDLSLRSFEHEHRALGKLNLYQWIRFVGLHEARHTAQIHEIADALTNAAR